jgi:ArsR family transcriptional regulator
MKDAVRTFRALSEPTRLRIVLLLMRRDLCVCELMFILKMEQSRLSHQLRILRDAGLVKDVRQGRWIIYRVPAKARATLEALLAPTLKGEIRKSAGAALDVQRMDLCLREDIRFKHGRSSRAVRAPSRQRAMK